MLLALAAALFEKSCMMTKLSRNGSDAVLHHLSHNLCTSSVKKRTSRGHRANDGTRRRRCRLDSKDVMECLGRFGRPDFFFCVACCNLESGGICNVKWGFCHAHLDNVSSNYEFYRIE